MKHAAVAVGRLQGGAEVVAVAIEVHPQLHQPLHAGWGLVHQQLNRGGLTETSPSAQGVFLMAGEAVLRTGDRRNPSLGPPAR